MAPWEGVNALDSALLYNSIGVLRQQIHPCNRMQSLARRTKVSPNYSRQEAPLLIPYVIIGNVTYDAPRFKHMSASMPHPEQITIQLGLTAVAGIKESHDLCIHAAKGMAVAGLSILKRDELAEMVRLDFEDDKKGAVCPQLPGRLIEMLDFASPMLKDR